MREKVVCLLLALFILLPGNAYSEDMHAFMQNTLNQMQNLVFHAYQGQERGYFIGGSASVRIPRDYIQPLSFTPPRLSVGCNGIDIIMGGFSYLDFDSLVQKLQGILQASPFLTFDLGIQTLCEPCSNAMKAGEQFSDLINKLNFDSCEAAEALVGWGYSFLDKKQKLSSITNNDHQSGACNGWFECVNETLSNFNQKLNQYASYYQATVNGATINHTDWYNPSFIHNVFIASAGYSYTQLENTIRAYLGDIVPKQAADGTTVPMMLERCEWDLVNSNSLIKALGAGKHYEKYQSGNQWVCREVDDNGSILDEMDNMLHDIITRMAAGQPLTDEQIFIINTTEIPIYSFLKLCYVLDDPEFTAGTVEQLKYLVTDNVVAVSLQRLASAFRRAAAQYKNFVMQSELSGSQLTEKQINELATRAAQLAKEAYDAYRQTKKDFVEQYNSFLDFYAQKQAEVTAKLKKVRLWESYKMQEILARIQR